MPAELTTAVRDHAVTFYERAQDLVELVGDELLAAMRSGAAIIVVATPDHERAIEAHLAGAGVDLDAARRTGRYTARDAAETLGRITTARGIDARAFDVAIGRLVAAAAASGPVSIYGEMVDLLWQGGQLTVALELEERWNDLLRRVPFALTCGYRLGGPAPADVVDAICRAHARVAAPAERRELLAVAEAPGAARHFVAEVLERLGRADIADDAALVVSELATNALLHTGAPFTVSVEMRGRAIRLSIEDRSAVAVTRRVEHALAASGRGLGLVAAIADRWGEEPTHSGKVVWAELR